MGYQVKILKIAECSEWQPNPANPNGGAGETVDGAWLARRVTIQTSNTDNDGVPLTVYEVTDLLVPEPYSSTKLVDAVNLYKATLPERNTDEGLVF